MEREIKKICPNCGEEIEVSYSICPHCSHQFYKTHEPSISGQIYAPSIDTTAYSPSFEELAEAFEKDPQKEYAKKTKEELSSNKEYFTNDTISSYLSWGYLKKDNEGKYTLTDLGRQMYRKNRELKKKLEEQP